MGKQPSAGLLRFVGWNSVPAGTLLLGEYAPSRVLAPALLKAYIWSILLYGCECWTLTKDLERRLEAAEMGYIRRIMIISWTEKKSNEEVMEMAGYKRSLLKTIRKRQLQFFGHINRADGLEKKILSGKICGTKSSGRQRTKYTDSLNNFVPRKESLNSNNM